ncbi:MAG: hypothetical protein AAF970_09400 [Bacteroidota bacterium]
MTACRAAGILAAISAVVLLTLPTQAQTVEPEETRVQLGLGLFPRVGWQLGYVQPGNVFIREAVLYTHITPGVLSDRRRLQATLGVGGAIRALNVARLVANITNTNNDLDLGVRVGPSLAFATEETRADKNQRFNLFIEPFLRLTTRLRNNQVLYTELGIQQPSLRIGLWVGL